LNVRSQTALVAYRTVSEVAAKSTVFLITVVAARRLSPEAFGIYSLGTTIGWIAAVASDFGLQLHIARAVAQRPGDADALLRKWLRVRLGMAAAAGIVVAATLLPFGAARPFEPAILLFALVYLVSGLVEFLHYFYRGLSRSDIESTLTLGQRLSTLAVALVVLSWWRDPAMLAAGMLLPAVATFAYSLHRARQMGRAASAGPDTGEAGRTGGIEPGTAASPVPTTRIEFQRDVFPIGAGIVLSALYLRIDVFFIELWKGTATVGLYNAVFRLVEGLRLFPAALLAVKLPSLCRATDVRPLVRMSVGLGLFAVGVSSVLWIVAEWLIPQLYGAAYAEAVPTFRILLLSFPLMSLNYALTHQLIGWNGHRAYAGLCAAALVFNIALNTRLVPSMSIEGAAWATFWTEVLLTGGCVLALWTTVARAGTQPLSVAGGLR
jgi:O-antigen/teichoic acid export membrane protein